MTEEEAVKRGYSLQVSRLPAAAIRAARTLQQIDGMMKAIVNAPAHTLPAWGGEVAALLEDIQPLCSGGTAVTVMAGTPRAAAGLAADLRTKGLNVTTDAATEPSAGLVQILPGQLSAGCSLPFAKYAMFTGPRLRRERCTEEEKAQ